MRTTSSPSSRRFPIFICPNLRKVVGRAETASGHARDQFPRTDDIGLTAGCTSLACYEPLFGYRGEALKSHLEPGQTAMVRDGSLISPIRGVFFIRAFSNAHPGIVLR